MHIHAARVGILPIRILLHVAILTVRIGLLLLLHICFLRLAIGTGRGSVAILPVRRAGIIALVCISGRAVGLLIILARLARVLICAGGGIAAVVAGGGLIILPRLAVRLLITLARIIPGVKRGNARPAVRLARGRAGPAAARQFAPAARVPPLRRGLPPCAAACLAHLQLRLFLRPLPSA